MALQRSPVTDHRDELLGELAAGRLGEHAHRLGPEVRPRGHGSLVVRLLLGGEISGASTPSSRVAGFGVLSLGTASWPGRDPTGNTAPALRAMLTYNPLATLYFLHLSIGGEWVGPLLWPAVGVRQKWRRAVGVEFGEAAGVAEDVVEGVEGEAVPSWGQKRAYRHSPGYLAGASSADLHCEQITPPRPGRR